MKPRLLDLFCCQGGAAKGYADAGFEVVGIDIEPQPRYPYEFHQLDALHFLSFELPEFDAIHASPPCQSYSRALSHLATAKPMLLDVVRARLEAIGLPWVIENVVGAPMPTQATLDGRHGVELCGSMFGLRVRRHRLFETSFDVSPPRGCDHRELAMNPHNAKGRQAIGYAPETQWRDEMGVGWMDKAGTRQAVPPVFTEHIGGYLMAEIQARQEQAA